MDAIAQGAADNALVKRRFRNYLLDAKFQLHWVLRVTLAATIIVSVMGYGLYDTVAESSDQILAQKLGNPALTPEVQQAFIVENQRDKRVTLLTLVGGLMLLVVLLGVVTVLLTHKIAGPVYKMKQLFSGVDDNHLQLYAKLRKGDELQDIFVSFDEMLRRLREGRHQDLDELEAMRELIVARGDSDDLRERIDEMLVRYRDSVKMD